MRGLSNSQKLFFSSLSRCLARICSWLCTFFSFHQRSFCFFTSATHFIPIIWPFGPHPFSVPSATEAAQEALIQLECWSEYWCLCLNPSKCEASFFSVHPHQANLQPNLLLLNSRLHFNPTPTFLGVTFDHTLSFSKHVYLLKTKFFPRLKALHCVSASSWGPSKEDSLFCIKLFLSPISLMLHPDGFLS